MKTLVTPVLALALLATLSACGQTKAERGLSGGAIGAGVGAAGAAVVGGNVLGGAVLGGAAGALTGILTDPHRLNLD